MPEISQRAELMPASPIRKLVPLAEAARSRGIRIYHLNIGQPDLPSPQTGLAALKKIDRKVLEYSPSDGYRSLREKLAGYYQQYQIKLSPEEIIVTTGGSEAVLFAFMSCLNPGDEIIVPEPAYANYMAFAISAGAVIRPVVSSIEQGFALPDVAEFEKLINERTRGILICNPNNPTGSLAEPGTVAATLEACSRVGAVLVVDECFLPFTDGPSCKGLLQEYPNLIVLRAFTKLYAMAGLRLGYLMTGDLSLLHAVAQQLPEWNVSSIAQRAGISALQDTEYEKRTRQLIEKERRYLIQEFLKMGCTVFPSEADYITFRLPQEKTGFLLKERLLEGKILIRSCANYRNMPPDCYRIAVKQHADNEELVRQVWRILIQ